MNETDTFMLYLHVWDRYFHALPTCMRQILSCFTYETDTFMLYLWDRYCQSLPMRQNLSCFTYETDTFMFYLWDRYFHALPIRQILSCFTYETDTFMLYLWDRRRSQICSVLPAHCGGGHYTHWCRTNSTGPYPRPPTHSSYPLYQGNKTIIS